MQPGRLPLALRTFPWRSHSALHLFHSPIRQLLHCRPAVAVPDEATAGMNVRYIEANEDALSAMHTSSANLARMQGKATKQFMLTPGHLDFGPVRLGQVCATRLTHTLLLHSSAPASTLWALAAYSPTAFVLNLPRILGGVGV